MLKWSIFTKGILHTYKLGFIGLINAAAATRKVTQIISYQLINSQQTRRTQQIFIANVFIYIVYQNILFQTLKKLGHMQGLRADSEKHYCTK